MGLYDYLRHKDDYTAFLPLVKIVSSTLTGSLLYGQSGRIGFSACPQMELILQLPFESVLDEVTVVWVGWVQKEKVVELVFLVVDAYFDKDYRRIGISSLRVDISTFERVSSSLCSGYSGSGMARYNFVLQRLCRSARWCEQSLVLR
jgi:hypothetical protein